MGAEPIGSVTTTPQRSEGHSIRWLVGLAVVQTFAVVALLIVTFQISTKLESMRKENATNPAATADKLLGQLADVTKKRGQPEESNPTGFTFDSVAVFPVKSKIDATGDDEAAKVAPALVALLEKHGKVRVIPLKKVAEYRDLSDPVKAGAFLEAGALLTARLETSHFVSTSISLKVELIETKTGLALWATPFELGEYDSSSRWKQKLTESLPKIVAEIEARSANIP
jgi:hypothetical protein